MHDPVLWPSLRCQHGPLVTADDRQRTDCQAGRQDMLLRERQGCVPYPALAPCLWRLHADRCAHAYPTPASGGARLGDRARADDAELHACPGFRAQRAIADVRGPQQPQLRAHACVAGVVRVPRGCGGASGGSLGGPARVALGLGGRPAPPALVAARRERVPAAAGGRCGGGRGRCGAPPLPRACAERGPRVRDAAADVTALCVVCSVRSYAAPVSSLCSCPAWRGHGEAVFYQKQAEERRAFDFTDTAVRSYPACV